MSEINLRVLNRLGVEDRRCEQIGLSHIAQLLPRVQSLRGISLFARSASNLVFLYGNYTPNGFGHFASVLGPNDRNISVEASSVYNPILNTKSPYQLKVHMESIARRHRNVVVPGYSLTFKGGWPTEFTIEKRSGRLVQLMKDGVFAEEGEDKLGALLFYEALLKDVDGRLKDKYGALPIKNMQLINPQPIIGYSI